MVFSQLLSLKQRFDLLTYHSYALELWSLQRAIAESKYRLSKEQTRNKRVPQPEHHNIRSALQSPPATCDNYFLISFWRHRIEIMNKQYSILMWGNFYMGHATLTTECKQGLLSRLSYGDWRIMYSLTKLKFEKDFKHTRSIISEIGLRNYGTG